ncbi:hypothetical protein UVI_02023210 [Ustilaginoidea virens]|uniref:DNA-binding protein RAP1 n=1 Tax=Ustilaginoidea virens TaxID=1159556 RepID=A0A1B5L4C9_USTVR|nr:hypothetical protein UVI_02023210 [Ustilaginoidea virens]
MAGGIAYNGVGSSSGGTIFKDMVFWVALKVPRRNDIINLIKSNGGAVARLEKDAHMLIADHARRDAPPDSYSWTYIADSVRNGTAQLTDRYRILGRPATSGSRGSGRTSAPLKSTRTPFSAADDAALANWVLSHGSNRSGIQIYQDFAETVRYVKQLSGLSNADLRKLALSAADIARQTSSSSCPSTCNRDKPEKAQARDPGEAGATRASSTDQQTRSPERAAACPPPTSSAVAGTRPPSPSLPRNPQKQVEAVPRLAAQSDGGQGEAESDMRGEFYDDLCAFIEATGANVQLEPRIEDQAVDLYRLGRAVNSQKAFAQEVEWEKVAQDVGFDWPNNQHVLTELQACFEHNLADFFEASSAFFAASDAESARDGDADTESSQDVVPISSPAARDQKRLLEEPEILPSMRSPQNQQNPSKRRRLSHAAVIPSTPEDRLALPRSESPCGQTAALQMNRPRSADPSQVAPSVEVPAAIEENRGDGSEDAVSETSPKPPPRLKIPARLSDGSPPPPKLLSEAINTSPIPLNLNRPRRAEPGQQRGFSGGTPKPSQPSRPSLRGSDRGAKRSLPASFRPRSKSPSPNQAAAKHTHDAVALLQWHPDEQQADLTCSSAGHPRRWRTATPPPPANQLRLWSLDTTATTSDGGLWQRIKGWLGGRKARWLPLKSACGNPGPK